ncbi:MAG: DNA mismatch repair endonuclease MutL [Treponema sp.]|jgi:DNA mismatch repair protein MutL|nr:DNA mismatch repair endonuclease MutL [Treponema sp.]
MTESTRIRILPPEEAKKIAAGEVVDRPAALVREFIDNALDSGASTIELFIEGGGIRKIEVSDNGSGMSREDLSICLKTHATSKIRSLDDLGRMKTLGFRGEALAAAAAVARLEILSAVENGEAWLLESPGGGIIRERGVQFPGEIPEEQISAGRRTRGTSVRAFGLFDAIPARKRFLKREGTEAILCRQIFIEKALAFPEISFRFIQDGQLKINAFPSESGCRERFGDLVVPAGERRFLHEIHAAGKGFSVTIVFGGPELFRHDRRQQYVFANRRRVQDFSLVQALEYGLSGFFPNGSHPAGAVFVDIDPALADFNIHPAKREVRFADPGAIHHAVTSALAGYVRGAFSVMARRGQDGELGDFRPAGQGGPAGGALAMEALLEHCDEFTELPRKAGPPWAVPGNFSGGPLQREYSAEDGTVAGEPEAGYFACPAGPAEAAGRPGNGGLRLVGRVFGLFIIVEKDDRLFIIDQHAAHERVLYERFLSKPIAAQELLVPIPFSTESEDEDVFLREKKQELARLGIVLESEDGAWKIEALPAGWRLGDGETTEEILSLRNAGGNMAEKWAASLACKAAIKDGGYLDDVSARELAAGALEIPEGRCPHGRPIWLELSRNDLFKAVRRTE